ALEALTTTALSSSGTSQAVLANALVNQTAPTLQFKPGVDKPRASRMNWLGWAVWLRAGVLMIATIIGLLVGYLRRPPVSPRVVPFTSFPGQKSSPVFSPDGNQIAFIWDGGESAQRGVYVKVIGEGAPLQVASNPSFQLAWAADGRSIAFDRAGKDG